MICSISLLLAVFALHHFVFALPQPLSSPLPVSITLHRKRHPVRDGKWARKQVEIVRSKYSPNSPQKRATSGGNSLVNQNTDSSYYGSLAIGSPPTSFDVTLDTGSSDLWVAGQGCKSCGNAPTYDGTKSSSFKNLSTPFHITYGSGAADGHLASDVVQMAGFQVPSQTFAVCDVVSPGLLNSPVSGLMGLAYQSLASSKALPFWQALFKGGALADPLFSFFLTRFIDVNHSSNTEPGGQFIMGGTNTSLYTGEIEYKDIPDGQASYWLLVMTNMTVQGNAISLPSGSASYAAIDTGTTLVGGPANAIAAIFAQIPGSAPGTGDYESYYTYPCDTTVNVEIAFGGKAWAVNPADFMLSQISRDTCLGAFFELKMGGSAPAWIVGDTFLKNVYSVFRSSPPSVGFAQLSPTAQDLIASGPIPTPTIGENPALPTGDFASSAPRVHVGWSWAILSAVGVSLGVAGWT